MTDGHSYAMILFIFLFLSYFLPICCSATQPKPTVGPFKTSIVSVKDCSDPSRPYLKNPPMILKSSLFNVDGTNMLGGNLTVLRDVNDMKVAIVIDIRDFGAKMINQTEKMKLKCFAWRNGRWRPTHSFNNLNCHGTMLHFTFAATGVQYDKKTCMFKKGFYIFKNMDVNKLQHIWVSIMPYERLLWRSETFYKNGMVMCKEFDTITEPAG